MNSAREPLVIERTVAAPAGLVWEALTDIRLLRQWRPFFDDFRAEIGFETRFELGRTPDRTYTHICEVTEVVEGKRLTYSWRYENHPGDSYVTFELTPLEEDKTKIVLTHVITEPFPSDNPDFVSRNFVEGWTDTINRLKQYMEHKQ